MNINLHIERLVLDGVALAPGQRNVLQAVVAAELMRRLSVGGLSPELTGGGGLPSVPANAIQLSSPFSPHDLGKRIASSVYSGICK